MDKIWNELYSLTMKVINPREESCIIKSRGVATAVESVFGRIYVSAGTDTACTLGVCAEHDAIFNMITNGDNFI